MSLSSRLTAHEASFSRPLVLTLGLAFILVLSACGFRPLYGTGGDNTQATPQHFSLIQIDQIKDRVGQQLRNHLLTHLNPKGEPAQPAYLLHVSVTESISNLGVKKSAVVTRGNLTLSASYTLKKLNAENQESLSSGSLTSVSSYDIPQDQYAALAATKNARARAVREIADDLKIRLGVYFKQDSQ